MAMYLTDFNFLMCQEQAVHQKADTCYILPIP